LEAVIGILGKGAADHPIERRCRSKGLRFTLQNRGDQTGGAGAFKRALAAEHFVEHTAETEQVAAGVGSLGLQLFGCHVLERAQDLALLRERLRNRLVAITKRTRTGLKLR
jgi:hypothetical protein